MEIRNPFRRTAKVNGRRSGKGHELQQQVAKQAVTAEAPRTHRAYISEVMADLIRSTSRPTQVERPAYRGTGANVAKAVVQRRRAANKRARQARAMHRRAAR